jgi:hypothetical protein
MLFRDLFTFWRFIFYFYGFSWDGIHLALAGENSTLSLAITTLGGFKNFKTVRSLLGELMGGRYNAHTAGL